MYRLTTVLNPARVYFHVYKFAGKMPDNDLQLSVLKLKPKTKIMMMGTREDDMVRRGRGLLDSPSDNQTKYRPNIHQLYWKSSTIAFFILHTVVNGNSQF